MTEIELRSQAEIKETAKLCETALLEAGVDYDGIESSQNWLLHAAAENDFSIQKTIDELMKDTVEMLNNYAPEVSDMTFDYEMRDNKPILTVEAEDIDPVEYHDGTIHDIREQIEEMQEQNEYEEEYDN